MLNNSFTVWWDWGKVSQVMSFLRVESSRLSKNLLQEIWKVNFPVWGQMPTLRNGRRCFLGYFVRPSWKQIGDVFGPYVKNKKNIHSFIDSFVKFIIGSRIFESYVGHSMVPMGSAAARVPMRASSLSSKTLHTLQNFSVEMKLKAQKLTKLLSWRKKGQKFFHFFTGPVQDFAEIQLFNKIVWLIAWWLTLLSLEKILLHLLMTRRFSSMIQFSNYCWLSMILF